MSTTTPNLGLTLYNSTTDQVVTFATFRAVWGGPATSSNFYLIDTAWGDLDDRITSLESTRGAIPVLGEYVSANYFEATGISDITSYYTGLTIILSLDTTSNGTVTLNINSLGTKSVMKNSSTGTAINLTGSDLTEGRQYLFVYDGAEWLWVSANSADQINIVGTSQNLVTVGADNTLLGTTTQSTVTGFYNVKVYGAVGDGSNDDTTAIQAAINAVPTFGGVVFFPSGAYKITSSLTIAKDGVVLQGSGGGTFTTTEESRKGVTRIITATGGTFTDGYAIIVRKAAAGGTCGHVGIKDIQVECSGTGASSGIMVDCSYEGRFINIQINSFTDVGFFFTATTTTGVTNGSNNNIFENIFCNSTVSNTTCFRIGEIDIADGFGISQNVFIGLRLRTDGAASGTVGLNLRFCDANTFMQCTIVAHTPLKITPNTDVVNTGTYPEAAAFYNCPMISSNVSDIIVIDTTWSPVSGFTMFPFPTSDGSIQPTDIRIHSTTFDGRMNGFFNNTGRDGVLENGYFSVTVTSNNITVAIKTLAGSDPSKYNPVSVMINKTRHYIVAALSVTKIAGTNWFGSGGTDFAALEVDYFVYLGYNATDGVVIGFSTIPWARSYGTFNATSTNRQYAAISTITNAVSTDYYVNIGRFAALLSATASFNWSVPTFTAENMVQRPVFTTRLLAWNPTLTGWSSAPATPAYYYEIQNDIMQIFIDQPTANTSNAVTADFSAPMVSGNITSLTSTNQCRYTDNGTIGTAAGLISIAANGSLIRAGINFSAVSGFTASGNKAILSAQLRYPLTTSG